MSLFFNVFCVKIPREYVPKVMGQSGVIIKEIQEKSRCKLSFEGPNGGRYLDGRVLSIKARSEKDALIARQMVEEICGRENVKKIEESPIDQKVLAIYEASPKTQYSENIKRDTSPEQEVEDEFMIPTHLVPHVVGRGEENLKSIQNSLSLTSIEMLMPCTTTEGANFCPLLICGPIDRVEQAKNTLQRMLNCFVPKPKKEASELHIPTNLNYAVSEEYLLTSNDISEGIPTIQPSELLIQKAPSPKDILTPIKTLPVNQKTLVADAAEKNASIFSPVQEVPVSTENSAENIQSAVSEVPVAVLNTPSPNRQVSVTVLSTLSSVQNVSTAITISSMPVKDAVDDAVNGASNEVRKNPSVIQSSEASTQIPPASLKIITAVIETAVSSTSIKGPSKRQIAFETHDKELRIKIQKKQLKVFNEQQGYFKKRCLLVEKQIEQIELNNYEKKTQLGIPASLSIHFNGQTIQLQNQFASQDCGQEQ